MKIIIMNITLMLMFSFIQTTLVAQSNMKTDTMTVYGNCGECKERIEDASYIKGVKHAEWNKTTKILTVVFNTEKTSMDQVAIAVANVGHDSKNHKATDKAYKKLPHCCAYRTGVCVHE